VGEPELEAPATQPASELVPEAAPEALPQPTPAPSQHYGTGRRKEAVARVFLRPGSGQVRVNQQPLEEYFKSAFWRKQAREPLEFAGVSEQFDAYITVAGGGPAGQAGAVRLGLARALADSSAELRLKLRQGGFLTRDARMKERKKYGQKGARKRFQWTKR